MATKSSLRRLMARTLDSMDASEIQRQSNHVFELLVDHKDYKRAQSISLYLSTSREIDTIEILRHTLEVEGKRCFIPHILKHLHIDKHSKTGTRMVMVELESMRQYEGLPINKFGIKEMASLFNDNSNKELVVANPSDNDLDLIIVPGVAFSLDGRRLGHGKGYYDEFLWHWQRHSPNSSNLHTIGLALREQIVSDPLAIDGQDFKLNEILVGSNPCIV